MASLNTLEREVTKLKREVDRLSSVGTRQRMRGPVNMSRNRIENMAEGRKGSDGATVSQLVGGGLGTTQSFVTVNNEGTLDQERALTAGAGISLADGGANSTLTVSAQAAIDEAMLFTWFCRWR